MASSPGSGGGAYSQLLFLRARYYEPKTGRFTSKDPWPGDIQRPPTLHKWSYVQNNPVGLVDPSGWQTPAPEPVPTPPPGGPQPTPTPTPELPNHRDLTYWLYNEIHQHATGYYAQRIHALLASTNPADRVRAYAAWTLLVKDEAKWDFKHRIRYELQQSILLRHKYGSQWFEYSVPGNIFYAFVGQAAGFTGFELHAGASVAEIIDPIHRKKGEACCPQYCNLPGAKIEFCISLGCYYINPEWWQTGFDEPGDWWNVEFGVRMFNTYGRHLTFDQFQGFLATHGYWLTPASTIPEWDWRNPLGGWPYDVGRFDGPDAGKNDLPVHLLLGTFF